MTIEFAGLLRIDLVRSVYDSALHGQLANVVQIAGDRNSLYFVLAPTQLARNDLAVFPDTFRVPLRVGIFDVDGRGESAHGVAVDGAQVLIESLILFGSLLHFSQQTVRVNADADVPHHCA